MKAYGGVDVEIHIFLTSALVGGEWSTSRPSRFNPEIKVPQVPIGQETGWVPEPIWTWIKFFTLMGLEQHFVVNGPKQQLI
jgi:hypothetical protein